MTAPVTIVVRFDQELSVAHKLDDYSHLPCPRGVLTPETDPWDDTNRHGTRYRVHPCALTFGHTGPCHPLIGRHRIRTVCGLELAEVPFVPSPEGTPACPHCYDTDDIAFEAPDLFGDH